MCARSRRSQEKPTRRAKALVAVRRAVQTPKLPICWRLRKKFQMRPAWLSALTIATIAARWRSATTVSNSSTIWFRNWCGRLERKRDACLQRSDPSLLRRGSPGARAEPPLDIIDDELLKVG